MQPASRPPASAPPASAPATAAKGAFDFQPSEVSSLFDELTPNDLKPKKGSKSGNSSHSALSHAKKAADRESAEGKKKIRGAAKKELYSSMGILLLMGTVRLAIGIFLFTTIGDQVDAIAASDPEGEIDLDALRTVLNIIFGINLATAALFFACGAMVFMFPMTCSITAITLFVIGEIIGLLLNPLALISIRGWIVRAAMFGAMIQAVNNAAYYKFVKTGGRD